MNRGELPNFAEYDIEIAKACRFQFDLRYAAAAARPTVVTIDGKPIRTNHIGFYPTPSGIKQFKKELSTYQSAKGSVQFPLDQNVSFNLIKKIVKFRLKETREKAAVKKKAT